MKKDWKAGAALVALVFGAMLVAILVMAYTIWDNWQHDQKTAYAQNMAAASAVATRQSASTGSTEILLHSIEATRIIQDSGQEAINALFERLNAIHMSYLGLAAFSPGGVPLAASSALHSTLPLYVDVVRERSYFKRALASKGFQVGEAFAMINSPGNFFLPMTHSVQDESGKIRFILFAPFPLAHYDGIINSLGINDRLVLLFDRNATLMYTSQPVPGIHLGKSLENPALLEAVRGQADEVSFEAKDIWGNPHPYSLVKLYHPSSEHPYMYVFVKSIRPNFLQFVQNNFWREIATLLGTLVVGMLFAQTLGRKFFSDGLERLAYVAQKTQNGELSARCGKVTGCSEIRLLGKAFDAMLDELEKKTILLEEERSKLEIALDSAALGTWEWSNKIPFTQFDKRFLKLLGFDPENAPDCNLFLLIHPDDRRFSKSSLRAHLMGKTEQYSCEVRLQHQDGHWLWVLLHGRLVKRDDKNHEYLIHGTGLDITQHKRLEQMEQEKSALYRKLSRTDELTGLWNRRYFYELSKAELRRAAHVGSSVVVVMTDLDHFKKVNDCHGHQKGDHVLQSFAKLLQGSVRESDIVARYGGEEFIFFLPDSELSGASILMEKIRAACEELQVAADKGSIRFTASFGISALQFAARSKIEQPTEVLRVLIEQADKALYAAKNSGRNKVLTYDESMN